MGQNTDCPVVDCWNRGGLKIESSAPRSSSRWNAIYAGGLVGYCEEPVYNSYNRGNISLIDAHIDVEGSSQEASEAWWERLISYCGIVIRRVMYTAMSLVSRCAG